MIICSTSTSNSDNQPMLMSNKKELDDKQFKSGHGPTTFNLHVHQCVCFSNNVKECYAEQIDIYKCIKSCAASILNKPLHFNQVS